MMQLWIYESVLKPYILPNFVLLLVILWCDCGYGVKHGMKKITEDLNVATEDFKTMVSSGIFVDKSLLINETLNCEEKVLQITRPRKWGKTLNLDMLKRFFEIEFDKKGNPLPEEKKTNTVLFKGGKMKLGGKTVILNPLKVSGWDDVMGHMGKHPVIYASFKDVKGKSYQQFEESLKNIVIELFLSYPFLKNLMENGNDVLDVEEKIRLAKFITRKVENEDFICCFEFLSLVLYKHFHSEVCIFIDDYDFPIINAFLEFGDKNREFDSIIVMLRVIFENAFKENQYLLKGILTGTLNFFVLSTGVSEYHFVDFSTVLDSSFSGFYGFTQKDIGELLGKAFILFNPIELRKWYGGFHVNGEEIYNPWSVMKCLSKKGKYDYYLQYSYTTDYTRMFDRAFVSEDMQEYFHLLIEGKDVVRSKLSESVYVRDITDDLYSVFVHAGYLDRIPPAQMTDKPIWRMKIPNMDVRAIFAAGVAQWVAEELKLTNSECERFINLLAYKKVETFGDELEQLLKLNKCNEQTKESYYHTLMGGIVSSLGMKYLVETIKEFGQNKGGSLLIPYEEYGSVSIHIEYCICEDLQNLQSNISTGLKDLLNRPRPFTPKMKDHVHVKKMLYVAIGFCGPKVLIKHKIVVRD